MPWLQLQQPEVSRLMGVNDFFTVTFNNTGARSDWTADVSKLGPESFFTFTREVVGDATTREVVILRIEQRPLAFAELTTALPAAAVNVVVNQIGDANS
jgi:hypothetical protein